MASDEWKRNVSFHLEGNGVNQVNAELTGELVTLRWYDADSQFKHRGNLRIQRRSAEPGRKVGHIAYREDWYELFEGDRIHFFGAAEGSLVLEAPSMYDPRGPAGTIGRNVDVGVQVHKRKFKDEAVAAAERAAAEDTEERIGKGLPLVTDIVARLEHIDSGVYLLPDLHAAICRWPLHESMRLMFAGTLPLYPFDPVPDPKKFDEKLDAEVQATAEALQVIPTRQRRMEFLQTLDQALVERLTVHFGTGSRDLRDRARFRQSFTERIKIARQTLALHPERTKELTIYVRDFKNGQGKTVPAHIQEALESRPSDERRGSVYEVTESL